MQSADTVGAATAPVSNGVHNLLNPRPGDRLRPS